MTIGSNIKFIRKEYAKLNQTDFAAIFGITRGMVDSYERGVAKPNTETLAAIAKHYNLSIDILLSKDIRLNPGILISGGAVNAASGVASRDLLAAKEETIKMLKAQVKRLEEQNAMLMRKVKTA